MARGRRPDPPGLQAAKGHPGKRRSKAAAQLENAQHVAALLAAAPAADPLTPPVLTDPRFAGALKIWSDLAPELVRTHRLPRESRLIFVQLCVYTAEWLEAELDIVANGYSQRVKTVAGGYMERQRPMVQRRERAFDNVLKLSERFGLTPHDLYTLFKDQAAAASNNPGLFDGEGQAPPAPQAPAQPAGLVGAAARFRTEPPAAKPN